MVEILDIIPETEKYYSISLTDAVAALGLDPSTSVYYDKTYFVFEHAETEEPNTPKPKITKHTLSRTKVRWSFIYETFFTDIALDKFKKMTVEYDHETGLIYINLNLEEKS